MGFETSYGGMQMIRLYREKKLMLALIWIGIYVVGMSLADGLSESLGMAKAVTAPFGVLLSVGLLAWLYKQGLTKECGLCSVRAGQYLWFVPLIVICSSNLWLGVDMRLPVLETVLYLLSMLSVGFLEEIIFRSFLFRAMYEQGTRYAILISGVAFGLGHIVNLLNGALLLPTLMQICYATAIGILFTVIYLKSGSLLPCIIAHCATNMLSAFAVERANGVEIIMGLVITVLALLYTSWIWKKVN